MVIQGIETKKYMCKMLPFAMPEGLYFSDFAKLALSERAVKYLRI